MGRSRSTILLIHRAADHAAPAQRIRISCHRYIAFLKHSGSNVVSLILTNSLRRERWLRIVRTKAFCVMALWRQFHARSQGTLCIGITEPRGLAVVAYHVSSGGLHYISAASISSHTELMFVRRVEKRRAGMTTYSH